MFQGGNTGKPEVGVSFAHPFANIVKSSNIWEVAQGAATDFTQDRQTEFITDASDGLILGKTLYAGMETVADADRSQALLWVWIALNIPTFRARQSKTKSMRHGRLTMRAISLPLRCWRYGLMSRVLVCLTGLTRWLTIQSSGRSGRLLSH